MKLSCRMKISTLPVRTTIAGLSGSILAVMALSGCAAGGGTAGYRSGPLSSAGIYVDDYDYFPGYETYYSRSRHEYYYREGSTWVSRPQPRGVAPEVLQAAPSVRMDFHDAPAAHHNAVVQAYPKNWKRPEPAGEAKPAPREAKPEPRPEGAKDDKRDDRKDEDRKN